MPVSALLRADDAQEGAQGQAWEGCTRMPRKWWQGWRATAAILLCLPTSLALFGPAVADVAGTERAGAWSVTRYLGERGDSWCGWTTTWTDPADDLGRSVSFQMRGDESPLFLFVEGAS